MHACMAKCILVEKHTAESQELMLGTSMLAVFVCGSTATFVTPSRPRAVLYGPAAHMAGYGLAGSPLFGN